MKTIDGKLAYRDLMRGFMEATKGAYAPSSVECSVLTFTEMVNLFAPICDLAKEARKEDCCGYCRSMFTGLRCPNCGASKQSVKDGTKRRIYKFMGADLLPIHRIENEILFVNSAYPDLSVKLVLR